MALKLAEITPSFTVCGQVSADDLDAIVSGGFGLVINNRPDGEEEGQPDAAKLGAALAGKGIDYAHIPVIAGQWDDASVSAFREAMGSAGDRRVLAFCRSGMRAAAMWVLAEDADKRSDRMDAAARANVDLSKMRGLGPG